MKRRHALGSGSALGERAVDWIGGCRRFQADAIEMGINSLRDRAIAWQNPEITSDDIFQTIVPKELQSAAKLMTHFRVYQARHVGWLNHAPLMNVDMVLDDADWALPSTPTSLHGPGFNKLKAWCQWRYERGCEWGLVKEVWTQLNYHFHKEQMKRELMPRNQLPAVRYLWPTVLTLLEAGGEAEEAEKLRSARPPENIPRLSPELREAMRVTAGTVAATLLLPRPGPADNQWPVTLEMRSYQGPLPRLGSVFYKVI